MSFFLPGKLPNQVLEKMIERAGRSSHDPRVLMGPRIGEDAAVLAMDGKALVVAADPITYASDNIGWYAVIVNANDVAVRGALPRWFSATLLLPEGSTDETLVGSIFDQIRDACQTIGCTLIGGHTEITLGLPRPIVAGQMLGEVERDRLITTGGARIGDHLLMTGSIAVEGTAVLARELGDKLLSLGLGSADLDRAKALIFRPGIDITRPALTASRTVDVHAMHDPTEGGLATGLAELAQASMVGLSIDRAAIKVLPECQAICRAQGLDPLGLLASGSLLISVAPTDTSDLMKALAAEGIPCAPIGRVVARQEGLKFNTTGGVVDLPSFARDEAARALSGTRNQNEER